MAMEDWTEHEELELLTELQRLSESEDAFSVLEEHELQLLPAEADKVTWWCLAARMLHIIICTSLTTRFLFCTSRTT